MSFDLPKNFTDRSRRALHLAETFSARSGLNHVASDFLLVGVLMAGPTSVAATAFLNLRVRPEDIVALVEKSFGAPAIPKPLQGFTPYTPAAEIAIKQAVKEARQLGHPFVGVEHILLAILADENNLIVRSILSAVRLTFAAVRAEVLSLLGVEAASYPAPAELPSCPFCAGARVTSREFNGRGQGFHPMAWWETHCEDCAARTIGWSRVESEACWRRRETPEKIPLETPGKSGENPSQPLSEAPKPPQESA